MKGFLLLYLVVLTNLTWSQGILFLRDRQSQEPIPFAKIIPEKSPAVFSDIDGKIYGVTKNQNISIRAFGYSDTLVNLSLSSDTVYLLLRTQRIQEVTAEAGENPAHRIMKQVIENRRKNHPVENDAFTYKSYSKFSFDVDPEFLASIPDSTSDTNLLQTKDYLNKQMLFLIESAAERRFIPPYKDREDIIAYKVSGFTHPLLSSFAQTMQSFSFYENTFEILGESYINPIARGGLDRYLFILEDTTVNNLDTTFTIYYRPRKGKNFNGMEGQLFISTKGFAIEKVTAEPYFDTASVDIKIVQEYKFTNDYKWFPDKLSTQVVLKNMQFYVGEKQVDIIGKGNTYIDSVEFNPPNMKKRGFDNVSLATDEDAHLTSNDEWKTYREDTLIERENNTYNTMDSLVEATGMGKMMYWAEVLMSGKIPLGKVNLLADRLVDFNQFEQFRLGAGLETSSKLMENIQLGAYGAYGFGDQTWKYGAWSKFHISKRKGFFMQVGYWNDLLERGTPNYYSSSVNLISSDNMYRFFRLNFDRTETVDMRWNYNVKANIKLALTASWTQITYLNHYRYLDNENPMDALSNGRNAETSIQLNWNIREKSNMLGNMFFAEPNKYPRIKLLVAKAWKDIEGSDFEYFKANFSMDQTIKTLVLGTFSWNASYAQTIGEAPLLYQNTPYATNIPMSIAVMNTLETAFPTEFYHTTQSVFTVNWRLPSIHTKAKWNEPTFELRHGMAWGEFVSSRPSNFTFRTMDKGYAEMGVSVYNIIQNGFTGIGVGAFYRYGYYSFDNWKSNVVPKIVLSYSLAK